MILLLGLIILVAAVVVGVAGVLTNGGGAHALTSGFSVFGYHVTGSTGALFLYGIVIGAIAMLGLSLVLAAARRSSRRGRAARRDLKHSRRQTAAVSSDRDDSSTSATTSSTSARPPRQTRRACRPTAQPAATLSRATARARRTWSGSHPPRRPRQRTRRSLSSGPAPTLPAPCDHRCGAKPNPAQKGRSQPCTSA